MKKWFSQNLPGYCHIIPTWLLKPLSPIIHEALAKTFNVEKFWDSDVNAFIFWNLDMLQNFSMSQTFSMFQKYLEKVWDMEKCVYLYFLLHKISKKEAKTTESQHFSTFFWKKKLEKVRDIETSWDIFAFIFQKLALLQFFLNFLDWQAFYVLFGIPTFISESSRTASVSGILRGRRTMGGCCPTIG